MITVLILTFTIVYLFTYLSTGLILAIKKLSRKAKNGNL